MKKKSLLNNNNKKMTHSNNFFFLRLQLQKDVLFSLRHDFILEEVLEMMKKQIYFFFDLDLKKERILRFIEGLN